jgi:hypothetical protein
MPAPEKEIDNAEKVVIVIDPLEPARRDLRFCNAPDPGAAGRRLRDVHAEPRLSSDYTRPERIW